MKRILSLIISLIMIGNLFQCVSVLASPIQNDLTQNENFVYGDLNNDGDINVFDLMRMKSYVLENKTISYSGKSADVNDDNELSHKDINEMKSYILKNLEAFSFNANIDSDGDGICDYIEELLGLDPSNSDTDNDGLSDYEESHFVYSNPLKKESLKDGIVDSLVDSDGDGINNVDEIRKYNTNPLLQDSDSDGLFDLEEVNLGTDPNSKDTDNDGLSDYEEYVSDWLDPIRKDDTNIIVDQKMPEKYLEHINEDNDIYQLSVSAKMRGFIGHNLKITDSNYSEFLKEDQIKGKIIDVNYTDDEYEHTLIFELKNVDSPEKYMIFKYVKEAYVLLPAETQYEDNKLILTDKKGGTYCIVDISELVYEPQIYSEDEDFIESLDYVEEASSKEPIAYNYIFRLNENFKVNSWESGIKSAVIGTYEKLLDNNFSPIVNLNFYGSVYNREFKVSFSCSSESELFELCNMASVFFSKSINLNNAESEYRSLMSKSKYIKISQPSIEKLNLNSYNDNENVTFVLDLKANTPVFFNVGTAKCYGLGKNLHSSAKTYFSVSCSPEYKMYEVITSKSKRYQYGTGLFGSVLLKNRITADIINDYKNGSLTLNNKFDTYGKKQYDLDKIAVELMSVGEDNTIYGPTLKYGTQFEPVTSNGISEFADKIEVSHEVIENIEYLPQKSKILDDDSDKDGFPDNEDGNPIYTDLKNIFIYYERPDGDNGFKDASEWMADYAYNNENCVFYKVSSRDDLVEVWNNKIPNKCNNIHLHLHGGINEFCFYDGEVHGEEIINVFNEKIVNNKIYVYSCEGGSYGSLLRENPLHPERFDEKIMLDQKYNNYFKDTDELSLAEAIAFKCKNVNVEALANDEVDYYNVEIYPLNTDNSWISTYFNSLFFTYNILLNINDYYNIYYPKRHFEVYDNFSWMDYDGKWLEVKHDGEKFITNIIGRDWKL